DTLNIQSYMGAIMATGVAVANAILLVTFAERARHGGQRIPEAGLDGAVSRLRPILMTSAAMIVGMMPMALGGAENAPLARAVIGGLLGGTSATLFLLPSLYAMLQRDASFLSASLHPDDA